MRAGRIPDPATGNAVVFREVPHTKTGCRESQKIRRKDREENGFAAGLHEYASAFSQCN